MKRDRDSGEESRRIVKTRHLRRGLSADDRHRLIAEAAYRHAERRGFGSDDDPVIDWLDADPLDTADDDTADTDDTGAVPDESRAP